MWNEKSLARVPVCLNFFVTPLQKRCHGPLAFVLRARHRFLHILKHYKGTE